MASRKEGTGSTATSSSTAGVAVGKGKGKGGSGDSAVKQVQIDGLVVLKIIKHYQEEGQGTEVVQGVLLGLVVEDRLEITNCFPFPQHTEDDADFDEVWFIFYQQLNSTPTPTPNVAKTEHWEDSVREQSKALAEE
ncbi:hypothetical protein STEG23_016621 [Scotinomys teguina]